MAETKKEKPIAETINVQSDTKIDFEGERFQYRQGKRRNITQDEFMKRILFLFKKGKRKVKK